LVLLFSDWDRPAAAAALKRAEAALADWPKNRRSSTSWLGLLDPDPVWCLPRELWIKLAGKGLDDTVAIALAEASHLPDFEIVDLANNEIGPTGLAALLASPRVRSARVLRLGGNALGLEGLRMLAQATDLTNLQILELQPAECSPEANQIVQRSAFLQGLATLKFTAWEEPSEPGNDYDYLLEDEENWR